MTNSTTGETITKEVTSAAPVTSLNITSSPAITNTTTEVTTSSSITSSPSTSSSTVSPTTSTEQQVPSATPTTGSSAGAIVGGVLGGLVLVTIVIVAMVFLYRRRKRHLEKKRAYKPPVAPGKDDINKIEESRRQTNQYTPPPYRNIIKKEGLYANVNEKGEPNELTDPALDSQGYLKAKTNKHKEPGNELYYEAKAKSGGQDKANKGKQDKLHVNNEKQPLYENEDLHGHSKGHINAAFEADMFGHSGEHIGGPDQTSGSVKNCKSKSYSKSVHGKQDAHVEMGTTQVYTNANAELDAADNEETDLEYEVPDPARYPEPKTSKTKTYVNDIKGNKTSKSHAKDNTKVMRKKSSTEKEKPRESQYENMKNSAKYANVGHSAEAVTDEFYEVPENK